MHSSNPSPTPCSFDWITIPAGECLLGSHSRRDRDLWDDEKPQHRVHLPEYRIARVPVTVAQFGAFVAATGYRTTAEQLGSAFAWTTRWEELPGAAWHHPRGPEGPAAPDDHPATCVSWFDARAFCAWAGARLPGEAEWEKAARGDDGRLWPWGDEPPAPERCNFDRLVATTTPVGSYPAGASPHGLLDAAGNVWEWCHSLHRPYPYDPVDGREDPEAPGVRVVRGGCFTSDFRLVRCAVRSGYDPDDRHGITGFRVAT